MQGQMEVEEILEQKAWADRNGVELGAAYTPADALRAHEAKTYRDCPLEYEYEDRWHDGYWVLIVLIAVALTASVVWNWPRH